jgi:hypothetical protein
LSLSPLPPPHSIPGRVSHGISRELSSLLAHVLLGQCLLRGTSSPHTDRQRGIQCNAALPGCSGSMDNRSIDRAGCPEPSPGASCSPESSQSYAVESPVAFMAYCSEGRQVSLTSRRSRGGKKGGSQSQDGPPFLCPLRYNSRRTNVPAGCENVSVPTEAEAM